MACESLTAVEMEWFAIRTKPCKEEVARVNYEQQGYETYLPRISVVRRHARREERVLRPLFPGYLFLNLAPHQRNWVALSSTRGAVGPVRFGDQYIPVPKWIIDGIKEKEETGAVPMAAFKRRRLAPGMRVEVNLEDARVVGEIFSLNGKENVVVLLDILSRRLRTIVPLDLVEPL